MTGLKRLFAACLFAGVLLSGCGAAPVEGSASPAATAVVSTPVYKYTAPLAPPTTTQPPVVVPPVSNEPHRAVKARDWQLIAKDPEAHAGDRITVYAYVFQFDSATGTSGFLARTDGVKHAESYEYDTNSLFLGTESLLADVVEEDMVKADVTVLGSYSYETQMGGNTTVPELRVDAIAVIG